MVCLSDIDLCLGTVSSQKMEKKGSFISKKSSVVDSFLDEFLELLVSDSKFMKETAVMLLGQVLAPASYCIIAF